MRIPTEKRVREKWNGSFRLDCLIIPFMAYASGCPDVYSCFLEVAKKDGLSLDSGEPFTKKHLDQCLKEKSAVKDLKNGFLKFECEALTHGVEAAIFRGEKHRYMVVTYDGVSVCNIGVYRKGAKKGEWTNETKSRLPKLSDSYVAQRYQDRFGKYETKDKNFSFDSKFRSNLQLSH